MAYALVPKISIPTCWIGISAECPRVATFAQDVGLVLIKLIGRNRDANGRVSPASGKGRTGQCTAATRERADCAGTDIPDPDIA